METSIFTIAANSQKYIDNLNENINRAVVPVEHLLLDLNRQQLKKGMKSDGSILPNYSDVSVNVFGKEPGPIKLYDTGSFQNKFVIQFAYPKYLIKSLDKKNEKLVNRYSENIHGIAPINQPKAKEITGDAIAKDFLKTVFND